MDAKQRKYCDLIERVKASYPARNPSDDGKELRLYWCNDCKEINLWTYWQGRGNLDTAIDVSVHMSDNQSHLPAVGYELWGTNPMVFNRSISFALVL